MAFLAPLFFAALATLAIPIVIHLTQRERKQVVEFPSLMFLEKIPYQSVRRRRIRDWPLLAMRLAAILLIVLAFARPFFERPISALSNVSGPREVVILLDRSYSMGYGDRWTRAQAAARQAVQGLTATDHATLILFGTNAQAEVRATADLSRVISAIDAAKVSAEATRYAPALKLAQRVLADSTLQTREVVLISDFQRNGWVRDENLRLPEGTTLKTVPISDAQTSNLAVSTVLPQRSLFSGQERVTVAAGVVNRGPSAVNNVQVRLELDGRAVETQTISVQPAAPASVTFQPFTLARAFTRGTVRIGDDALKQDNAFHFVVSPAQRLPVLLVEPSRVSRDASLYLQKALSIGSTPAFQVNMRQGESVSSTDLDRHRVVILNDVAALSSGDVLKNFVSKGGGLFVILGERANWGTDFNDLLPAVPGNIVDRAGRGGALAELDTSHPVLEVFKAPRSGNLSTARFFRYRAVTQKPEPAGDKEGEHGPNNRVVARFDDGAIAMAERRIGSGHVMLWSSTLDNYWNDLALTPVFLPFVHQVVRHLATYEEPANWFTIGEVIDPGHLLRASGLGMQLGTGAMVLTPSGQRIEQSGTPTPVQLEQAGFYEVHGRSNQAGTVSLAANLDTQESDLTVLDMQELTAALAGRPGSVNPAAADAATLTPEDQERRQNFWWYLLMAGIVLLGLETAISNRMKGPVEGTRITPTAA
ncbi:MAG TPA: BatA and WFA domain-containing protein [Vicinamibacterales bacterium]|nr:BatA and WFA domain-containing protein [Vicinamibacterales bacterium]